MNDVLEKSYANSKGINYCVIYKLNNIDCSYVINFFLDLLINNSHYSLCNTLNPRNLEKNLVIDDAVEM